MCHKIIANREPVEPFFSISQTDLMIITVLITSDNIRNERGFGPAVITGLFIATVYLIVSRIINSLSSPGTGD